MLPAHSYLCELTIFVNSMLYNSLLFTHAIAVTFAKSSAHAVASGKFPRMEFSTSVKAKMIIGISFSLNG